MKTTLVTLLVLLFFGAACTTTTQQKDRTQAKARFVRLLDRPLRTVSTIAPSDYEQALVLAQNNGLLPFRSTYKPTYRVLQFAPKPLQVFQKYLDKYATTKASFHPTVFLPHAIGMLDLMQLRQQKIVIALDETTLDSTEHHLFIEAVNTAATRNNVVFVNFSTPENLKFFSDSVCLLQVLYHNETTESLAAQVLFGGAAPKGHFSSTITTRLTAGTGETFEPTRLKYTVPEEVGIASKALNELDELAAYAIEHRAFPGCQILVAKKGKVIYNKTFGHHTYHAQQAVRSSDLYDLASVTKVAATTFAAMKLKEEKKLALQAPIRSYLSGKTALHYTRIDRLLTHRSGFQAHIPIHPYIFHARDKEVACDTIFCHEGDASYSVNVADSLYLSKNELERIWEKVLKIKPYRKKSYRYSDANFVVLQRVLEQQAATSLDQYVQDKFYEPLGLRRILYRPLSANYTPEQIVPTTSYDAWRRQELRGYVHDEAAALLGGVAGHAGLFSNAEDLAALFQLLLNDGVYNGKRLLYPETIKQFTSKYPGSHRGLGFNKPRPGYRRNPCAHSASPSTFGHTGFSGTCVWVDPAHDLTFILLSNRIHPSVKDNQFTRLGIRTRMQQVVYDALETHALEPQKKQTQL